MFQTLTDSHIKSFQQYIIDWYSNYGRKHLPWRQTHDPYSILVSELMLQQTQVDRVIPKYNDFLALFPDIRTLDSAPLAQVIRQWQGLGYNRRAKFLHLTAQTVHQQYHNTFPYTLDSLQKLPGIGSYTASAIMAFAFDQPVVVIETNIRTVFIHHFFPQQDKVADAELLPLITATLHNPSPRIWYSALMDYGSHLKKVLPNPSRKSKTHTKQSNFSTSPRRVRGEIIRLLSQTAILSQDELKQSIKGNLDYFDQSISNLEKEGMIIRDGERLKLAS